MSGVLRAAWRVGAAAARGRAGRALSQAASESGGAEGGGSGSGSREAVERLVRAHPVVVFMKGSPEQPLCGFSNAVVQILRLHGVEDYRAHDVLQDPDLRQGQQRAGRGVCPGHLWCRRPRQRRSRTPRAGPGFPAWDAAAAGGAEAPGTGVPVGQALGRLWRMWCCGGRTGLARFAPFARLGFLASWSALRAGYILFLGAVGFQACHKCAVGVALPAHPPLVSATFVQGCLSYL